MSQQEEQAEHAQHEKKDKTFSVTVRATNGATWETEFKENEKVSKVIRESLDHFIAEGAMSEGEDGAPRASIKPGLLLMKSFVSSVPARSLRSR